MNRLPLRPLLRVVRAKHQICPSRHLRPSAAFSRCRFASTSSSPPPSSHFERLLVSLYPGMPLEELAKRTAALFIITDKKNEIEQVEKRLKIVMRGQNETQVSERVQYYLQNPPEDLVKVEGSRNSRASWLNAEAQQVLSENGLTVIDYLSCVMQADPCVELIQSLDLETAEALERDWLSFEKSQNPEALDRILNVFAERDLTFNPPSSKTAPIVKRAKDGLEKAEVATPVEPALPSLDPVEFARRTAKDATWIRGAPPPTENINPFPNLMTPDPLLDPRDVIDFPPDELSPYHNRVIVRNHRSVFHNYEADDDSVLNETQTVDEFTKALPVPKRFYDGLHQSILMRRGVVQQTGKGKIRRISFMVLVGNADGLVGYGEGKHANSMVALKSARLNAVKNMDWVERFEKRTVWTEMRTKLGGTELILRPRPVGFGLRCNPSLHQILRAAGFKDISAKVWGSRNRLNVIKAAFRMLQAGHAPTGMGDGLGGPGKKLSRGAGIVGKDELERARGRKLISLRK